MEKTKLKAYPEFSDHTNCKGHANFMLDSDLTDREDRNLLIRAIGNYLPDESKDR